MVTKVKASVLADTSVTPGTYGGATQHAVINIDAQGRAIFAGNVLPSIATTLLTGTINAQQVANTQLYGINITGNAGTATTAGSASASDVYAWAKASVKPSYTKAEVGLGNVDNTADANKSVNYATTAGNGGVTSVNGSTGAVTIASATSSNVLGATAGATSGAVGTYTYNVINAGAGIPSNATMAGSNFLNPIAGTWKNMQGYTLQAGEAGLWLRVS